MCAFPLETQSVNGFAAEVTYPREVTSDVIYPTISHMVSCTGTHLAFAKADITVGGLEMTVPRISITRGVTRLDILMQSTAAWTMQNTASGGVFYPNSGYHGAKFDLYRRFSEETAATLVGSSRRTVDHVLWDNMFLNSYPAKSELNTSWSGIFSFDGHPTATYLQLYIVPKTYLEAEGARIAGAPVSICGGVDVVATRLSEGDLVTVAS